MKQKLKNTIRLNRVLLICTIGMLGYTAFHTIAVYRDIFQKQAQIDTLEKKIQKAEQNNSELLEILEEGASDEAIAEIARNKLDLAIPGERIIVDSASK